MYMSLNDDDFITLKIHNDELQGVICFLEDLKEECEADLYGDELYHLIEMGYESIENKKKNG